MFFGSRKRHRTANGASHPRQPCGGDAVERQSREWQTWRRAARKVTRAWSEWLAADARHRAASYSCYTSTLAEEERAAAEIELIVNRSAEAKDASDRIPANSRSDGHAPSHR